MKPVKNKSQLRLLSIDDDKNFLSFLKLGLQKTCAFESTSDLKEAFAKIGKNEYDLILLDIDLGLENGETGLDILKKFKTKKPSLDVVMISGRKDPKTIVQAIRAGAADYLSKPFDIDELIAIIEKRKPFRDLREKQAALHQELNEESWEGSLIGRSGAFKALLKQVKQLRGHKASILIEGESGTGKEILARTIHQIEDVPTRPFVAVNCAAIPENLLESELFGYEKGAFTGAHDRKIGKFELADGGDLFLDELSCLKWDLQAKILRVLQEREFCRIGGNEAIKINVRVIAATNENLEVLVEKKEFRRDLYHRLRVIPLTVPPLRKRRDDIPLLIRAFLKKYDMQTTHKFTEEAIMALSRYYWPGNIRELENLVQSLIILVTETEITKKDLPDWVFRKEPKNATGQKSFVVPHTAHDCVPLKEYVRDAERAYISKALELTEGDKSKAAGLLGISRTRLYERLRLWGML